MYLIRGKAHGAQSKEHRVKRLSLFIDHRGEKVRLKIQTIEYRGWKDSVEILNVDCRVVVVPAIGRIMHYGFRDAENMLWENPALSGIRLPDPDTGSFPGTMEWMNFGGDKVWPMEQGRWSAVNGSAWPPDPWFDGAAHTARLTPEGCVITGPVSRFNGGRSVREIRLAASGTRLSIRQRIEKMMPVPAVAGGPVLFTNWNVTQVRRPERILFPAVPRDPSGPWFHDYVFEGASASDRARKWPGPGEGTGIFTPDPVRSLKIGADTEGWLAGLVGEDLIVERFERVPDAAYPDGGLTVAAYSCPEYAELEIMSPLRPLTPGDTLLFDIEWELTTLSSVSGEERLEEAVGVLTGMKPGA